MTPSSYKGVRALVTGQTGFKGAWLCSWLLAEGAEVAGLALPPEGDRPNLHDDLKLGDRMASDYGDIRSFETVTQAVERFQPEIVFHLAAQALVRRSYADPLGTFGSNVMGTAHVLEASRHCESVRAVVCVTTDKVYQNNEWPWGYREVDRLGGKDPYSASKAAAEIVAGAYLQTLMPTERLKLATARGGNVIGGGDWSEDRLVPDVVRSIQAGEQLVLRNPGAIRPWQHVLELCRGYMVLGARLLEGDEAATGAWNFGPSRDNEVDVGTVVNASLASWGGDRIAPRVEPSPLKEANFLKLDVSKAEAGLGWRPMLGFQETIDMTLGWYRDYTADRSQARALTDAQIGAYRAKL